MTRDETRAKWSALVSEQASSGKSAVAWCRERQVDYAAFLRWKRRFAEPAVETTGGFVELVGIGFSEPVLVSPLPSALALDFGHGLRLELPPDFDAGTLRRAVSVLREAWR
jgi:hypothetical protein